MAFCSPLRRLSWRLLLLCFSGLLPLAAQAQQDTVRQQPYAFPEAPALTFIGAGNAKITRPVVPRALATELVNGIDSAGHVRQGVALALAPWSLLNKNITLSQYQTKPWQYILANAQVSLGTVRVAGDANATDLGLGGRLTIIDKSDPMRDPAFTNSIRAVLVAAEPIDPASAIALAGADSAVAERRRLAIKARQEANANPQDTAAAAKATRAENFLAIGQAQRDSLARRLPHDQTTDQAATQKIAQLRQAWNNNHWNAPSFAVAAATGWRLSESRLAPSPDNRQLGWSAWATGATPLLPGNKSQLLAQVRYTRQRLLSATDPSTRLDNQLQYGARTVFGSAGLNFFLELTGTNRSDPPAGQPHHRTDWSGGLEFRALPGMWLSTSIGNKLSTAGPAESALVFAGLHWQLASSPKFAPGPGGQ